VREEDKQKLLLHLLEMRKMWRGRWNKRKT